jgi:hypothetical protein
VEGKTLGLAVAMAAAAGMGIGMAVLYGAGPPPAPERPRPPPPPEQLMNTVLRFSPTVYRGLVEEDARKLGVPAPRPEELAQPFPYFEELRARKKLKPKDPIETAHLKVSLEVQKREAVLEGQRFSFDHLVLRIENRTPGYLAYRVVTQVPDARRCQSKGDIPHNAIVLEPRQAILRTECLFRSNASVDVSGIEVMELPPLGAHYVSRMPATSILFDPRTTAGHLPLKGQPCPQTFSWREIKDGLDRKQIGWKDVIDFYARHSCEEYSFFSGYRYRADPALPLPARPLD